MRGERTAEEIVQNLIDAGCDEETIECFLNKIRENKETDGLKLLSSHRKCLLDSLHKNQKCIDCLDYLVYELEKKQSKT